MLDPASITGLIGFCIDGVKLIYQYIESVHNATKTVSWLQEELDALKSVLVTLDSILKEEAHIVPQTSALFKTAKKCTQDLKKLQTTLDRVRKGHFMARFLHRMVWPLNEGDTIKTTENFHRYLTIFQLSLTAEGLSLLSNTSTAVQKKLDSLGESSLSICTNVRSVKQAVASVDFQLQQIHHEQEYARFLDWLPTLDYQQKHLDVELKRLEGTCQWLLNGQDFRSWCEDESSNTTLFCRGGPGVGKTFLTSIVIDYLQGMCETSEDKLAYLYLDYNKRSEQNAVLVASCLLKQILSQYPSAPKPAYDLFDRFQRNKTLPQWSTIRASLIDTCSDNSNGKHFIVIDALDEYDEGESRGEIIDLIRELIEAKVRLFATSRPFPDDIMSCFVGASIVEVDASESDLVAYIKERISKATRLRDIMTEELIDKITNTTVAKAQGMFLLLSLQLKYVLGQPTYKEVERALERLPSGLWANFNLTMARIRGLPYPEQRAVAMRTILWVAYCFRILSVQELKHAIAISSGAEYIDWQTTPSEALLVEYCCGLVTVDSDTETIHLAHYSIYEYFQQQDQLKRFGKPHLAITKACLNYLMMDVFRQRYIPPREASSLLDYAAQYWGLHANMCQTDDIKANVQRFLQDAEAISLWAIRGLEGYQESQRFECGINPLHVVAHFGLLDIYLSLSTESELFSDGFNCKTVLGETPLIIASKHGRQSFVEFLLSRDLGDQVNDVDISGRSSLLWAVTRREVGVVKVLTAYPQVDVNRGCPLLAAVNDHSHDICALLIKRPDLDINAADDNGETVFSLLLGLQMCTGLARVLLERVDLDPREARVDSKIREVEENAEILTDDELMTFPRIVREVVKLCVRRSRLESKDTFLHWFTLWICCGYSLVGKHSDIVLGWLNEGFEYSTTDEKGFNLLHAAVVSGNVALLGKAIELGVDVNAVTGDGETALHLAARLGGDAITRFLLSNAMNLDVNAKDSEGCNPLFPAIQSGGEVIVRILLEAGVDANQANEFGHSPLLWAAWDGKPEIVLLLVQHRADVNRGGANVWTPLHAAAWRQHLEVSRTLLEHGANVDLEYMHETALDLAAGLMDTKMVELLIQHGADPTRLGPYGRTPLDWASRYEPAFNAMGPARLSYRPTPKARMIMTLRKTIDAIIEEFLHGTPKHKGYHHLGHTLLFLGNRQDAVRAFEMPAFWDNDRNLAVHAGVECTACSTEIVGVEYICECCPEVNLCSSCFETHAAGENFQEGVQGSLTTKEERKVEDRSPSGADPEQKWFDEEVKMWLPDNIEDLENLGLPDLDLRDEDFIAVPENAEAKKSAKEIEEKIPWCSADHPFIGVPGPEWMETKGASAPDEDAFDDWLRELKARYMREAELEEQGGQ